MSSFNGAHRGISISKYINNLNEPEPVEVQELDDSPFALFTNVGEFADVGNYPIDNTLDFNFGTEESQPAQAITPDVADKMDFPLNGDFQFTDFSTNFANPILDNPGLSNLPQNAQSNNFALPQQQQQQQQNYSSPVSALSPAVPSFDTNLGKKRKLGEHGEATSQQAIDEAARLAAEEDKRRRNTAASARFRVKKKQREQTLEKTAKEMSERVNVLEARIQQLETENTWLKGLITEKNGGKTSTSEIRAMLSKREEDNNKNASERSSGTRTDGVGTKA